MKWLTLAAILSVLTMPVSANEIVSIPTALYCGKTDTANSDQLRKEYGEIAFLEAEGEVMSPNPELSYQGKVQIYLDPNDGSYSVFLEVQGSLTCLIVTGEKMMPSVVGNGI